MNTSYRLLAAAAIFVAAPAMSATLTTVASFGGTNGISPSGGLYADGQGNLYGTTITGGMSNNGTVYRLDTLTDTLTTLASFSGANGKYPSSSLIADAFGNLYGTANGGGSGQGYGTIFRLDIGTNSIDTLASFHGYDGQTPVSGLTAGTNGSFYGTTLAGGPSDANAGTIFRLDANGTLTTLSSFGGTNGKNPNSNLISDASGSLYGTTSSGGTSNNGTIFRFDMATNQVMTLANFSGATGVSPQGLVADAAGNFYGTTEDGGSSGMGTIFRFDITTNSLTTLFSFTGANGESPRSSLITDLAGNLFGTTYIGGASHGGTAFRYDIGTDSLTTLASFNATTGRLLSSELIADAAGNLYGTASGSGPQSGGTIFRISEAGFVTAEIPIRGPVPEPATWTTMILGFGLVGAAMRRPRAVTVRFG